MRNPLEANQLFLAAGAADADFYRTHLGACHDIQIQILQNILGTNAQTAYGQKHKFHRIKSVQQYQDFVPVLTSWEELKGDIQKMELGAPNILFQGLSLFFEETSGSMGRPKVIPYCRQLLAGFQRALNAWLHDLNIQDPEIFSGAAYWSLSPPIKRTRKSPAGIPVGAPGDAAYFSDIQQSLLREIVVIPERATKDATTFYIETWAALLMCPKLTFISVWSPVFLIRLHQFLMHHHAAIAQRIASFQHAVKKLQSARACQFSWALLFPDLRLISCWNQGQASVWMPQLQAIAGTVPIQGKGLLATEGVTTIPYGNGHHLLAYTAHFYEFRDPATGVCSCSNDLTIGVTYEIILTTQGGLYRYATGDLVICVGYVEQTPDLKFLGRGKEISDMVGEKLSALPLPQFFKTIQSQQGITATAMYLCSHVTPRPGYRLLISGVDENDAQILTKALESCLFQNPYYEQAVQLGQLTPLGYLCIPDDFSLRLFRHYQNQKRIRDGDIKLPLLYTQDFLKPLLDS
jgi:hypothetical protein